MFSCYRETKAVYSCKAVLNRVGNRDSSFTIPTAKLSQAATGRTTGRTQVGGTRSILYVSPLAPFSFSFGFLSHHLYMYSGGTFTHVFPVCGAAPFAPSLVGNPLFTTPCGFLPEHVRVCPGNHHMNPCGYMTTDACPLSPLTYLLRADYG